MIEVAREPTASALDVAAAVLSGPGGALVVAFVVLLLWPASPRSLRRPVVILALIVTCAEFGVRAAAVGLVPLLSDPRGLGLLARLALLVAGVVVGARWARSVAGGDDRVVEVALALTLLASLPVAGFMTVPSRAPATIVDHLTVEETALDLTIAPGDVGANELHLYAWDEDLRPADLGEVSISVAGRDATTSPLSLLAVSPNHHLTYELELPDPGPWTLRLHAVDAAGSDLVVELFLEEP